VTGAPIEVAVLPAGERPRRERLFCALEAAFPVRLTDGVASGAQPAAEVHFGGASGEAGSLPRLVLAAAARDAGRAIDVRLARDSQLDGRLRGRTLAERADRPAGPLQLGPGETALAVSGRDVLWASTVDRAGTTFARAAMAPPELGPGEALRDRLRADRFLALLPVVAFLRRLTGYSRAAAPPLRAAFVLDDPNLHWVTYGHVRYRELARSAGAHGYHVAMATVPLDGWLVDPRAARLFRGEDASLSLAVHGNDHLKRELARPRDLAEAHTLLGQARSRMARLERRAGVTVSRVMVPPHGACSEAVMRALPAAGFEAACIGRPFPWHSRRGDSPYAHPEPWRPLTGWRPLEETCGTPVILRRSLDEPVAELVLSAYLDQPIVLYGHHQDLAGGPGALEAAADSINGLGEVRWGPLASIVRTGRAAAGPATPPPAASPRPVRPWAVGRRLLSEGRDRLEPLQSRTRRATMPRIHKMDPVLSGFRNRLLSTLARILPGARSVRVRLHRARGVQLGERVFIGTDALIETSQPGRVSIGSDVVIGMRSTIVAHFREVGSSDDPTKYTVIIEDEVYIGPGVIILPGVTIGRGAVITAGSVVTRSIPARTMARGNPAQPIAHCEVPLGVRRTRLAEFRNHTRRLDPDQAQVHRK
jgi:acetyltransferase-like isoleucine patch superfamily enzyme